MVYRNESTATTPSLATTSGLCKCGCEQATENNYCPGHDARHVSNLLGILRNGHDDMQNPANTTNWDDAVQELAKTLPTQALTLKFHRAADRLADKLVRAAQRQNERDERHARKHAAREAATTPLEVKVGRWTYPARLTERGLLERNTKRDGSGEWVRHHDA